MSMQKPCNKNATDSCCVDALVLACTRASKRLSSLDLNVATRAGACKNKNKAHDPRVTMFIFSVLFVLSSRVVAEIIVCDIRRARIAGSTSIQLLKG